MHYDNNTPSKLKYGRLKIIIRTVVRNSLESIQNNSFQDSVRFYRNFQDIPGQECQDSEHHVSVNTLNKHLPQLNI